MKSDPIAPEDSGHLKIEHTVTEWSTDLPLIQGWTSTALWYRSDEGDEASEHLGYATWVLVDLTHGARHAWTELDALGSDEETMAGALIQLEDEDRLPALSTAAMLITHTIACDPNRGTGLGRLVVKEAVRFAALGRPELPALLPAAA